MIISEYLLQDREEMPKWLEKYDPNKEFEFKLDNLGRTLFYPGARFDGQPIKTFNIGHYAHLFIYADYGITKHELDMEIQGIRGYKVIGRHELKENDLIPNGVTYHITAAEIHNARHKGNDETPFGIVYIFERKDEFSEEYGAKRFAVLYLYADGMATYDALFGNKNMNLDVLVLQDHAFGGNYSIFGKGGLLNKIAERTNTYPKLILCADWSEIWDGYKAVEGVDIVHGGMYNNERKLYKKILNSY